MVILQPLFGKVCFSMFSVFPMPQAARKIEEKAKKDYMKTPTPPQAG